MFGREIRIVLFHHFGLESPPHSTNGDDREIAAEAIAGLVGTNADNTATADMEFRFPSTNLMDRAPSMHHH